MARVSRSQGSSIALVERLVLASFTSAAGLTRPELEDLTGLSRTVVAGVVTSLVARGELVAIHESPARGARGRPASRYQRAALLPPVLLIKLAKDGSTYVSSVCSGGVVSDVLECTPWSAAWPAWSRSVADAARQLREVAQIPARLAVLSAPFPVTEGLGAPPMHEVPAPDLKAGGRLPPRSPWLELDPRPAVGDLLGCPALMVNDANLAALGEARFGAGRGSRAMVHVCVIDGVGAGFVFEGRLFTGARGFSGELAHVQINADGLRCVCGGRGCLVTEMPERGSEAAAGPNSRAEEGSLVGRALAPLVTALDPDCVVVDARLGQEAGFFVTGVTAQLARRCPPLLAESLTIVVGELDDAERLGALAAADLVAARLSSPSVSPAVVRGAASSA